MNALIILQLELQVIKILVIDEFFENTRYKERLLSN